MGRFPVGSWISGCRAEGAGQAGGQDLGAVRIQLVDSVTSMVRSPKGRVASEQKRLRAELSKYKEQEPIKSQENGLF